MVKDGDIFGDGVNIAARLEALAEPGGICVSRGVRDHLRNKGLLTFEDLGEQRVKNIAQPIRAFRVRFEGVPRTEGTPDRPAATPVGPESSVSDPAAFQLAFWDAIKDSTDPAEFEAYLEQYADGPFAKLAEARRQALREGRRAANHRHHQPTVAWSWHSGRVYGRAIIRRCTRPISRNTPRARSPRWPKVRLGELGRLSALDLTDGRSPNSGFQQNR